mgnify:FL=1
MSDRKNLAWLNNKRICYVQYPSTDEPTETYTWGWYYKCGTYQCYELFRSKAKINSIKSFKWHLYVLLYINSNISFKLFKELAYFLSQKENNFVSINISISLLDKLVNEIYGHEFKMAPKNKLRKVIFKIGCGLEIHEKLSIVGQLSGRSKKISGKDIYGCMLDINAADKKITVSLLAKLLCCSTKTVHRNLTDELKKEKNILNKNLS